MTSKYLRNHNFRAPRTVLPDDDVAKFTQSTNYPIIVKPRRGSGSRGIKVVFNEIELNNSITPNCIIQEYVIPIEWNLDSLKKEDIYKKGLVRQSDEYSTEVIVSKEGKILGSITNWRTMKKGYPSRAIIDDYNEINEEAEKIVSQMAKEGLVGPCNLQSRMTKDGPVFFEINPRFSGSTAIRCASGFNGPEIMYKNFVKGEKRLKDLLKYRKLVEIRYWNELYLTEEEFNNLKKMRVTIKAGTIHDYM
jgi:carbamoyl-phosphate synthase large subunit